jgi:HAMP domain-containing protein
MSYKPKNKTKFGIREELLASFAILTIIALGSITAVTGIYIGIISNATEAQTSQELKTQIQDDMGKKTKNYAAVIQNDFQHVVDDLEGLSIAISDIFQNPVEFAPRKAYYHTDYLPAGTILLNGTTLTTPYLNTLNRPPDYKYSERFGANISLTYSHYLIYTDTYNLMGKDEYNLTGYHGMIINRTSQLDPLMAGIYAENTQYAWIYLELASGIQRNFPWFGTDEAIYGPLNERHDYKTDGWYINAVAAGGKAVFSSPYIDPNLGWMITVSIAVYNGTKIASNLLGVFGIDILLDKTTEIVSEISFMQSGYIFLTDNEGNLVAHRDVEFDPESEDFIALQDVEPIANSDLVKMLTNSSDGFIEYTKGGKKYFMSYTKITPSGYILGAVVKQEDVYAPVAQLEKEIGEQRAIQIGALIGIALAVICLVLFFGLKMANSVVKPIQKLTNIAVQLATDDVKKAVISIDANFGDEMKQDDEIGDLARAFKNLLAHVKEDSEQ